MIRAVVGVLSLGHRRQSGGGRERVVAIAEIGHRGRKGSGRDRDGGARGRRILSLLINSVNRERLQGI
jgi:hypothetical protein